MTSAISPKGPDRPSGWDRGLAWIESFRSRENQLALVLSLVIGALVGLVVVAFILLTGRLAAGMYPAGGSGWRRVLIPTIGSLATGYLLYRFFPFARGSGIPQTKAALFIDDGRITLRTVLGKFFCCSASLASGIALGREGPSVQIGAGLASVIARRLGLTTAQVRWLLPVGASAALAAAFNTPIAAVLFSLEEIMGDLHAPVLGSVVLASATSWMVLHLVLGDDPLFHVAAYHLVHPSELLVYALLGVLGGFGSVAFVKLLLGLRRRFLALPRRSAWLQPVAGGLAVGIMGYFVPDVLGVGYPTVERALAGELVFKVVAVLAVLKLVATAVCYASGNAGGIFGPSLFIGAMIGASVGSVAHALFPAETASSGAYALVGMGTAFAGIIRTPLTSVIMIFELTRDYTIIVPLMISNLIAYFISLRLQREPIYEAIGLQDGIHLPAGPSRPGPDSARVGVAVRPPSRVLDPAGTIAAALALVGDDRAGAWPVVDGDGLHGMVRRADLERAAASGGGDRPVADLLDVGSEHHLASPIDFPHLHSDHELDVALERMGATGLDVLPVVSRANVRQLVGVVTLQRILDAYGLRTGDRGPDG